MSNSTELQLTNLFDSIAALSVVSGIVTIWGIVRKFIPSKAVTE